MENKIDKIDYISWYLLATLCVFFPVSVIATTYLAITFGNIALTVFSFIISYVGVGSLAILLFVGRGLPPSIQRGLDRAF